MLLGRVKERRPEKSLLLTGLRGVGKTVLLNEIERLAAKTGYRTVQLEAHEDKALAAMLVPPLRKLLFELDRVAGAGDKAKRGLAVLKGFINSVKLTMGDLEVGLDIEPEQGAADSGDLESDLPNLFMAVAEAAEERQTPVALLIDELQYFKARELSALIMAMHVSGGAKAVGKRRFENPFSLCRVSAKEGRGSGGGVVTVDAAPVYSPA